jgi:hypothetical protein
MDVGEKKLAGTKAAKNLPALHDFIVEHTLRRA